MIQEEKSYITGELYNMVSNHALAEEEILNLNTMASENIKANEEKRKKNDKATTEKAYI